MKKTILLLLSCSLFSFAFTQNEASKMIKGKILDMYDCPASFARINISQKDSIVNQAFADESGYFSICLEKTGTYDLSIFLPNYSLRILGILIQNEREMGVIFLNPLRRICYQRHYEFNNPPLFEKEGTSGIILGASELQTMGLGR